MNNSVFGKTVENIRKRVDVRLVTDKEKLSKLAAKPTFVNSKIFNENLVAVHKTKETLTLDRPAYVGSCILVISKTLVYDCHYRYIKNKSGSRAKLLFTDTKSLTYEITAKDVYKDFWANKDKFGNSDYTQQITNTIFFQTCERAESSKSSNLIGSESGRYFTILPANPGGIMAASFTGLFLLFVNEKKPSFSNHFSLKTCAIISIS